jgi:ubiquinone/menaquinone biosynthesis C-methylase UbiE
MWSIYNHPKLYDWYMARRLDWIEAYRRTVFMETVSRFITDRDRVLDVACGTGVNCMLIAERYPDARVTGVDANETVIEFARKAAGEAGACNVSFVARDYTCIGRADLQESEIDVVVCTLGLSVIPDWEKAVEHTHALLAPGGYFVVLDLVLDRDSIRRRLTHLWVNALFAAYHDRPILQKLRASFVERHFHFKNPIFTFVGQKA